MCLEFDFTYAIQISSRSVNPLSYFIYIYIYICVKTIIAIISKNKSKNSHEQNCRSEMNSAKSILPNFPVERFFCLH